MKMKRFLLASLLCMSFYSQNVFAETGAMNSIFFGMDNVFLGKEAPDFVSGTLTQDRLSLKEYRENKKAIIFFWATWCPYCRKEIVTLSKNMEDLKKKDIKLIMVNVGESPKQVRVFIEKNKIESDVFLDQDSSISESYRVVGLPTFVYVNKKGVINAVENALLDDYEVVLSKE